MNIKVGDKKTIGKDFFSGGLSKEDVLGYVVG